MIRTYCDICEKELAESEHGRLSLKLNDIRVEVMTGSARGINDANVCHSCVKKIIAEGLPTPAMMSEIKGK